MLLHAASPIAFRSDQLAMMPRLCKACALQGPMFLQTYRHHRVRHAAVIASAAACLLGMRLSPLTSAFAGSGSWPKHRQWTRRYAEAATAATSYKVLVPIAEDSEEPGLLFASIPTPECRAWDFRAVYASKPALLGQLKLIGIGEIETACITDVLTRAGADVTVASVSGALQVRMSRGLKVVADKSIEECADQQWDVIALPGGMPGAEHLRDSQILVDLLKVQKESGRLTAAVCASPAVVFAHHGLVDNSATCYPAPKFKELVGPGWQDAKVLGKGLEDV
ncbi:DJ1C [Symbiodinium natans]|uniref:DJ1C protein n=1 Tax=Symbiodinium natans TaxID=878477 RepID=A0A812TKW5_9DINO|nr:DJ1C [Symbiodinium natans]